LRQQKSLKVAFSVEFGLGRRWLGLCESPRTSFS